MEQEGTSNKTANCNQHFGSFVGGSNTSTNYRKSIRSAGGGHGGNVDGQKARCGISQRAGQGCQFAAARPIVNHRPIITSRPSGNSRVSPRENRKLLLDSAPARDEEPQSIPLILRCRRIPENAAHSCDLPDGRNVPASGPTWKTLIPPTKRKQLIWRNADKTRSTNDGIFCD